MNFMPAIAALFATPEKPKPARVRMDQPNIAVAAPEMPANYSRADLPLLLPKHLHALVRTTPPDFSGDLSFEHFASFTNAAILLTFAYALPDGDPMRAKVARAAAAETQFSDACANLRRLGARAAA
jgi:hypothetical protein